VRANPAGHIYNARMPSPTRCPSFTHARRRRKRYSRCTAPNYSGRMNIPNEALVLVGDGRKALFLRNRGTQAQPELVLEDKVEQDNPPTREQGTDRPGRKPASDGVSHSAIEETDQHQRAEQRFAVSIAQRLYDMGHAHEYQALVVVAPPKMLGDLRAALHPEVRQRIVGELPKDLLSQSIPELTRLLS
jgi:protein required for attachment to host cells